jgi:formylglycine-generating enzyme required for sulfatase activity
MYQSVAFVRWLNHRLQGRSLGNDPYGRSLIIGRNAEVRLPTEWEWQWAAQGGSQHRAYPWGAWQDGYANTREAELGQAVAVGMYPHGAATCGALDLAGNLWEWCMNKWSPVEETSVDDSNNVRVLRGGSFYGLQNDAFAAARDGLNYPVLFSHDFGLRVVGVCAPLSRL